MEITKVMFTLALNISSDNFKFLGNLEHGNAFDVSGPLGFDLVSKRGMRAPHNFQHEVGQANP